MTKRPHGIEGVGGMTCAGSDTRSRGLQIGVGMTETDTHPTSCRVSNHFRSAWQFGRNGHDANMATGSLPEPLKHLERRW